MAASPPVTPDLGEEDANHSDQGELYPSGKAPRGVVPLISKIPLKTREKIWAFEYVDLIDLLPELDKPTENPIVF